MQGGGWRAAAAVAALVTLAGSVGGAAFLTAREDPAPTTTTTSTSTTTTTVPTAVVVAAIADALGSGLPAEVSPQQARCIASALLDVVDLDRLEALVSEPAPLTRLTQPERDGVLRGFVRCVPPEVAAAILGSPTSTAPPPVELPDEDV